MNVIYVLLCVVEVVVCLLLIGVILLQRGKDGGAAGLSFGGGMGEALFGAQMGNVLTRATVILGFVFLANTLVLSILSARKEGRSLMDSAPRQAPPAPITMPADFGGEMPAPAVPAAEVPAAAPAAPEASPVAVPVAE